VFPAMEKFLSPEDLSLIRKEMRERREVTP
jgi:hypothetical protein